jgi:hypothetical protein
MRRDFPRLLQVTLGAGVALVLAVAASANAPVVITTVITFEEQLVAPGDTPVATNGYRPMRDVKAKAIRSDS